jgi:light-regulated signal transduction histidine kinase (bacteriophytochrome)
LLINTVREYNIAQDVIDERNLSSIKSLLSENVDKQKQYIEDLNNQLTELQVKLTEVNKVVDKIKNSKLSKYLK